MAAPAWGHADTSQGWRSSGTPPTAHPGGDTDGMEGQHPPHQALERFGGVFQPQEQGRGGVRGCSSTGGVQAVPRWFLPMSSNPPPTLRARGWHCRTPALGSLRHRNVYFSKFFVSVLFWFFLQNLLPVPADGAWPPPELSTPSIPKAPPPCCDTTSVSRDPIRTR